MVAYLWIMWRSSRWYVAESCECVCVPVGVYVVVVWQGPMEEQFLYWINFTLYKRIWNKNKKVHVQPNVDLTVTGIIQNTDLANERRRYKVTPSLIDWAYTQNEPWV